MKFLIAAVAASLISLASAACPNLCNGHGDCGANDRCTCFKNWQGADCSERVCAFGLAWVDAPSTTDTAHWYAECSNKGTCDRSTGLCQCFDGYTGKGCKRSTCPNSCSGHGTCYFIEQFSAQGTAGVSTNVKVDWSSMQTYTKWDKSKIQGCVCDPYYEGNDCSQRQCPRGDNVLTLTKNTASSQTFGYGAIASFGGEFTITFTDLYGGVWQTRPITVGTTAATNVGNIQNALEALPNSVIPSCQVTYDTNVYTVTFSDPANAGTQNLLKLNVRGCKRAGCSPKYTGISKADGTAVTVTTAHVSSAALKENAVCSEHGTCDSTTGQCKCFSGFYGLNCDAQTILV